MPDNSILIEVCVDSLQAALIAQNAGADRIELCERLDVGGVSPRPELIREVRDAIQLPFVVLIRPRPGDFVFDASEQALMRDQAAQAVQLGAIGCAIGGLSDRGDLDHDFLRSLVMMNLPCDWVMHRAFDAVRAPIESLEELINIGFRRVLTSGGPSTAICGLDVLRSLVLQSAERIEVLPAGGINSSNASTILAYTQCDQLHGSFSMSFRTAGALRLPDTNVIQSLRHLRRTIA